MLEKISANADILIILMIFIIILGIFIMLIPIFQKNKNKQDKPTESLGLNDTQIKKLDKTIDKELLIKDIFDIYKKVEVAKSKFNYETLKELLDESLYKEEEQKLKQLKTNKQKLIATNIKLQEIKILSIQKKNKVELINVYLHVSEYNYVIDNKKNIIRGTDESEYQIEYKITLEKNTDKYFKIKKQDCVGKWIINK